MLVRRGLSQLTVSEKGLIREANVTAATLLGVGRSALVQQPFTRFILPADQDIFYRCRRQLSATGNPQACELRLVRADGLTCWVHLAVTVIFVQDITERKEAEAVLARGKKELEALVAQRTAQWNKPTGICR